MRHWWRRRTRSRSSSAPTRAGGAFRYAGKAPLFQDVVAQPGIVRPLCRADGRRLYPSSGVTIRYNLDVTQWPELLRPFDRIVIATGAAYRFGLGPMATRLLDRGVARWPLVRNSAVGAGAARLVLPPGPRRQPARGFLGLARPGQKVVVIGDALTAGKSRPAIASAFEAALRP